MTQRVCPSAAAAAAAVFIYLSVCVCLPEASVSGVKHSLAGIKERACGSDLTPAPQREASSGPPAEPLIDCFD